MCVLSNQLETLPSSYLWIMDKGISFAAGGEVSRCYVFQTLNDGLAFITYI